MKKIFAIVVVFILACQAVLAQGRQAPVVGEVRINRVGPGLVDEGFVAAHISVKAGQTFEQPAIAADVKNLLATERFTDVRVEEETVDRSVVLIYNVQGRLSLGSPVKITGAKHLSESKILELLNVNTGDLVDEAMLAARGQKVIKEYREDDYVDATLAWSVNVVDKMKGTAQVSLTVREGKPATVASVVVTGNKRVPSSALEDTADISAWWNPLGWFESEKFDKGQLEAWRIAMRSVCLSRGYLDAEVGEPQLARRKSGSYDVTYKVAEGKLYRVGSVSLKGITLFPEVDILRLVGLKAGSVACMDDITRTSEAIRKYYTDRGYTRTVVRTEFDSKRADRLGEGVLNVAFTVTEGSLVHVRNIFIRGNSQTREKVIRRELVVFPGEILAEKNVVYSENRLRNLGYFKQVTTRPELTPDKDEADLVFEVEEQPTGAFMVGGGFSSVDNFVGYFEISEGNFDVTSWPPKGAGQKVRLHGQAGSRTTQGDISLTEPWFLDRRLMLGLDLFANSVDNDDYQRQAVGGSVTLGWPVNFFFGRCETRYAIEKVDVSDISDTNIYERITGDRAGEPYQFTSTNQIKSSLSLQLTRDTRDDYFMPSRGHKVSVKGQVAGGILGGDDNIYGLEVKGEQHFGMLFDHILSIRARAEVVDEFGDTAEMPISDRLFAGGAGWARGIRGFDYRDVGPKVRREVPDTDLIRYKPIGGRSLALGNIEYAIPLVGKLSLVLFADAGTLTDDPYDFDFSLLAASAGVELRLDYRAFPIRINYGWVIHKDDESTNEHPWGFSLGAGF